MNKNFNNKKKVLMVQGLHEEGQKLLLARDDIEPITIMSANSHIYRAHEDIVLRQLTLDDAAFLPKYYQTEFSISEIMLDPESYIEEIRGLCSPDVEKRRSIYNPKPEVFE